MAPPLQGRLSTQEELTRFALHYKTAAPKGASLVAAGRWALTSSKGFDTVEYPVSAIVERKARSVGRPLPRAGIRHHSEA